MSNTNTVSGRILSTLEAELSDVPDIEGVTKVVFRLLLSAILGGVLGYDREIKGKAAGFRTHMLVAVGAAFYVLVPSLNGKLARVTPEKIQCLGPFDVDPEPVLCDDFGAARDPKRVRVVIT